MFNLIFPVALYAITASYFAGVMVRLMLTLTPVVCVLSAIAFSECFSYCLQDEKEKSGSQKLKQNSNSADGENSSSESEENSQNGPEKNSHKNLYDKVY